MNIIDAVKSGKRFKRKTYINWAYVTRIGEINNEHGAPIYIDSEEILAEDWEVEEETVTITKSQLKEACDKYKPFHYLARELGFK